MKNRIDYCLEKIKSENRSALVPYLTVGYPNANISESLATAVLANGADMLELGIPFSDPLADGPTIQMTSLRALKNGTNVQTAIDTVTGLRSIDIEAPLVFMGYFNPFLQYGISRFLRVASDAGLDGLIVPDLPSEESKLIAAESRNVGIHLIPLLAPTSTDERIKSACSEAGGFIYCVSLTGVTGARSRLATGVEILVKRIRKYTDLPVLVGFGVSSKEDVDRIGKFADGAVVGSALLDAISKSKEGEEIEVASNFIKGLVT